MIYIIICCDNISLCLFERIELMLRNGQRIVYVCAPSMNFFSWGRGHRELHSRGSFYFFCHNYSLLLFYRITDFFSGYPVTELWFYPGPVMTIHCRLSRCPGNGIRATVYTSCRRLVVVVIRIIIFSISLSSRGPKRHRTPTVNTRYDPTVIRAGAEVGSAVVSFRCFKTFNEFLLSAQTKNVFSNCYLWFVSRIQPNH